MFLFHSHVVCRQRQHPDSLIYAVVVYVIIILYPPTTQRRRHRSADRSRIYKFDGIVMHRRFRSFRHLFHSSAQTLRRFIPQRPSGQAVVTGIYASAPPPNFSVYTVLSVWLLVSAGCLFGLVYPAPGIGVSAACSSAHILPSGQLGFTLSEL